MKTIWKFPVGAGPVPRTIVWSMPDGAVFLSLAMVGDRAFGWFLVDTARDVHTRTFKLYGTGHRIDEDVVVVLGTIVEGTDVWHLTEALT